MKRMIVFLYGVICYLFFLGVFLYAIGFVGDILVPNSVDVSSSTPLGNALLINLLVLGLFAIQHTIMARPAFKSMLTKIIPEPAERSTYVLMTNIVFVLIFWFWQPMNEIIWQVENSTITIILQTLFWSGWGIVLISTFLIDHFELFGLTQVIMYLQKKDFIPKKFAERGFYKFVRHPLMLGFMIAFWATPTMTTGHLLFAGMCTGYIFIGLWFEERDLIKVHGEDYLDYSRRVPRLIPFTKFSSDSKSGT